MASLFLKCISGKTYRFTWAYLKLSLKGFLSGERPTIPPVGLLLAEQRPDLGDDQDLEVADLAQAARKIAAEFQTGLGGTDLNLFDAWKASGNGRGWQRRFARRQGVSDTWVNRHLSAVRASLGQKLREEKCDIIDPDLFIEFLHFLEAPSKEAPEEAPQARAETVLNYAAQQARLETVLADQPAILDLMAAYGNGQSEKHILANLPGVPPEADQETRCRVLEKRLREAHKNYVEVARAFWREVKAERYYERLQARKANVSKVTRASPPWPAEKVDLVRNLQALARQRVPFAELPVHLHRSQEEVTDLLQDIRQCKQVPTPTETA
jgi:hypothetical protein